MESCQCYKTDLSSFEDSWVGFIYIYIYKILGIDILKTSDLIYFFLRFRFLKGLQDVIFSDPPLEVLNVQFTTIPFCLDLYVQSLMFCFERDKFC